MSLAHEFLSHAGELLGDGSRGINEVDLRRSVSASYYALFHRINAGAGALIAPNVSEETRHRIQRWFEHAKMKEICGRFVKLRLEQPLLGLIGESASADLQSICSNFITLQDARLKADYNLSYRIKLTEALRLWKSAVKPF